MITTEYKYSPSVNIVRDAEANLHYIPTPNSKLAFYQLINDYLRGIRSFNIVGAFGTGKSAFLWALERNLNKKKEYFSKLKGQFQEIQSFRFLHIIGEYNSIIETFAESLGINTKSDYRTQDIIKQLDKYSKSLHKNHQGLVIVIDEFGKFLEYAAKNSPEQELYFIQQLAEFANDKNRNIFFITTLHQDFNSYSFELSKSQRNEWDKVKGRLKEIPFNEPVEQLLFLAAERLQELNLASHKDKNFSKLFNCIKTAKAFPLKDYFSEEFGKKLLPFDILAASIMTLSLQKYGQNERSLFSFIESNDYLGIQEFQPQQNPYYNISSVYDYLIHNYYSFLSTKFNPHYAQWAAIRTALERAEGILEKEAEDALRIIKTIGLLNIFSNASAKINDDFLCNYGKYSLGIKQPEKIIRDLEAFKIIRYVKHSSKYILFEGTDLNIELAIDEAGNLVERVTNVVNYLNEYFDFPYIPAKAIYYQKGTPRFFEFKLSEEPIALTPEGEVDGFINLVFSNELRQEDIKKASGNCKEAVLYGWYKNTHEIKNLIFEIEKVKKVRENNIDDKVAVRELESIIQHQIKLLNHYVIDNLYSENSPVIWYYKGNKQNITNRKNFNRLLSQICAEIYSHAPAYKNEMVNKTNLSGILSTARKNLVRAIIEHGHKKDLGFSENKFPPEKTIYLSLLREIGIHRETKDGFILTEPKDKSFQPLWDSGIQFLESTKVNKRNLNEWVQMLLAKPFKLKQGFIDFWLPIFLFIKRDDYALFGKEGYIPTLNEEQLDLIPKNPADFEIKAFDIGGVKLDLFNKYRSLLNQTQQTKPSNQSFIETIKPFLTFYRDLPEYAKRTKQLSKKAIALREAIANAKDPEKTFFNDFPAALGYDMLSLRKRNKDLEEYVLHLQNSIREIRTCYEELLNRIELFLVEEIIGEKQPFPAYKVTLQTRFKKLKKHLLFPHHKVFYQRLFSELDDRKSWLSSIAQACMEKPLEVLSDEEERQLYDKLKDILHELDNLCELSKEDVDEGKEEVLKLEITSSVEGIRKNLIRLPKNKSKEMIKLASEINSKLSKDRQLNIVTLTKILEEQLSHEK